MQCLYPIELSQNHVGCGQCLNCRIDKQRVWTCRILLESKFYAETSFITLTYSDETIPKIVDSDGNVSFTLSKIDLDVFIAKLRVNYRHMDGRFRFFAAAEYGMDENRPHYHLVIFGMGCQFEELVTATWGKGFVTMSEIIPQRAAYVAQYTLKKNWKWLEGQNDAVIPEFSRQSRMPGIGAHDTCLHYLRDLCTTKAGSEYIAATSDVFRNIEIDGKNLPLGEYLRAKLREVLGIPRTRRERLQLFNKPGTWTETAELIYGEDDYLWWQKHRFTGDIMHQNTPSSLHAKKKRTVTELPEARKRRITIERKKSKARIAFLSGGPVSKNYRGIGT